jgi:DNA gyrase subunit A
MKLGKLAGLEKVELQNEQAELEQNIKNLNSIISSEEKRRSILEERLSAFVTKYGDKRRTEVTHIEVKPEEKEIAEVIPEDVVVIATQSGLIKKIPLASFKIQKKGGKGVKSQDDALLDVIKTNTVDTLMFFTTTGKMYRLVVDNVPNGTNVTKGTPISTLIPLENGEKVIAVTSLHRSSTPKYVIFITKNGMIKKTYLEEYMKVKRNAGILALNVKEGDAVVDIIFQDDEDLVLITKNGMSIKFKTDTITPIGRVAMGVKGIALKEDDEVVAGLPVHKETDVVGIFTEGGLGRKTALEEFPIQNRGGKGTIAYKPTESSGAVVGALMLSDEDNVLISGNYSSICISAVEVPLLGKTSTGNIMIKNNKILSVTKI